MGDRKGIKPVKSTAVTIPKNLLWGTDLTWSNSGKWATGTKTELQRELWRLNKQYMQFLSFYELQSIEHRWLNSVKT